MKIESPTFTAGQLEGFMEELVLAERDSLVERLEAASGRLGTLAARVPAGASEDPDWNPHEVLAHIAVLSKFYGMLTYKIGTGAMTELDLIGNVNLRDVLGKQLTEMEPAELAAMAAADHQRTAAYLRRATREELERSVALSHGGRLSAFDIARLPLVAHLEQHLRQLERALPDR